MPGTLGIFVLAVAGIAGFVLLDATIRRTPVGVVLVVGTTLLTTMYSYLPYASLGGFSLFAWDVVVVLLLSAAIARLLRASAATGLQWLLIVFGVLLLASVIQGVLVNGLAPAVVEFRKNFYFVAVALYFSTVEWRRDLLDWIGRAWLVMAAGLLALALARWAVLPFGLGGWAAGTEPGVRVIGAASTLVLLQAFVIGMVLWSREEASAWVRRLTPMFLAGVVMLQHRTVWAVGLLAVTLAFLRERGSLRKAMPVVVVALVVIIALGATVFDRGTELQLGEQLEVFAGDRRTWDWRVEGWFALMEQAGPRDAVELVVGRPFGSGFNRVVDGRLITVSPHNFYVEIFLRAGLLGVGLIVALYCVVLLRLARASRGVELLPVSTLFLLVLVHPVYYVPYTPNTEQGILLGLGIAASVVRARSRVIDAHGEERVLEPILR